MYSVALPALLEYLQATIFLSIIYFTFKNTFEFIASKKKLENKLPDFIFNEMLLFFPFKKLFERKNPIQRSAFCAGIIITISKMIQLIIIDFSVGLPRDIVDLSWIIISYLSCILLGFASYLFILWITSHLNNCDNKLKHKL